MPLTDIQRMVVKTLKPFRTEYDYVGGGVALNLKWSRLSDDMDIFHDHRNELPGGVERELRALREAGFAVEVTTNDEWMVEVIARQYGFETRVQWFNEPETSKRFFPAVEDEELGFKLHQADTAVNKVVCAARRDSAPRDAVDLMSVVHRYSPLGPLVWAAAGKIPDSAPLEIIREIRRTAFGYSDEEIRAVRMEGGKSVTRAELRETLGVALDRAYDYCEEVAPPDYVGCLFVDDAETPVEADDEAVSNGKAQVMRLKDFTAAPTITG